MRSLYREILCPGMSSCAKGNLGTREARLAVELMCGMQCLIGQFVAWQGTFVSRVDYFWVRLSILKTRERMHNA